MLSKNTICLWYDGTALAAAQFYAETFAESALGRVHRAPREGLQNPRSVRLA
jgi:predicted 3-demethylubiquinone-9 3-methyltransferase (glyoxalase superfamily)